jgi:hypothetical protein
MGADGLEPLRRVSRLFLSFLELQVPMVLGAFVCLVIGRVISASSSLATTYRPGTYVFAIGDVLFLTVPVVVWMLFRGRGRRCSVEMALAMLAPVTVIAVLGELAGYPYLLWLVTGMYPAMSLGMSVLLVYRRDRFSGAPRRLGKITRARPA